MIIFKAFQGLENFYIKFQDFPYFSKISANPGLTYSRIIACFMKCFSSDAKSTLCA